MKVLILLVCGVALLVNRSYQLSCRSCTDEVKQECPAFQPQDCLSGVGKDVCGCCDKCLQTEGEICGGPWNVRGLCGEGLECKAKRKNSGLSSEYIATMAEGTCVKKEDTANCLDCRVVRVKCRSPESLGCPNNFVVSDCTCCPECVPEGSPENVPPY